MTPDVRSAPSRVREHSVSAVGVGLYALTGSYAFLFGGPLSTLLLESSLPILVGSGLLWYGAHRRGPEETERATIVTACSLACGAATAALSAWCVCLLWLRTGFYGSVAQPALTAVSVGAGFGGVLGHVYVERTRHYRENERLSHAVDASMDGIAVIDGDGDRHVYVNDAYASLYGFDVGARLVGREWREYYTNASRRCVTRDVLPALADRNYWRGTLTGKRSDGTTFPLDVTVSSLDGGYVVVARDVTEQRDREQRIQVLNRVLRHNLRNAFTVIQGHASLIGDQDDRLRTRHVRPILEEIDDLLATADKARGVERTLERRGQSDVIEAAEAVRSTVDRATAVYPDARIISQTEESGASALTVDGSVVDALNELVDNAIEHHAETGADAGRQTESDETVPTVEIGVRTVTYRTETRLEFTVADDGAGIPETERRAILNGQETPLAHGSGLGLWLVNWIVQTAGGDLRFADRPDGGTIVTLSFPQGRPIASESAVAPVPQ